MSYKYKRIQLVRSETTTFAIDCPPWEVPILAAVNGDDRITVIGETVVRKPLPDPGVEFDRLATKYKHDPETNRDYVAEVYGVGERGVAALAAEIAKAGQQADMPPVQTPEYDANDDPMKGLFDEALLVGKPTAKTFADLAEPIAD